MIACDERLIYSFTGPNKMSIKKIRPKHDLSSNCTRKLIEEKKNQLRFIFSVKYTFYNSFAFYFVCLF